MNSAQSSSWPRVQSLADYGSRHRRMRQLGVTKRGRPPPLDVPLKAIWRAVLLMILGYALFVLGLLSPWT